MTGENRIIHISTYGLAAFLFFTPFEYPLADLMSISPLRIIGLIAMALAVIDIIRFNEFKANYRFIGVFIWLIYGAITYLWSPDKSRFHIFYSLYLNNAVMFILFSLVQFKKSEVKLLKKAIVYGVGALLIYMTFIPNSTVYSAYQHRLTLNAGRGGLDQNYLAALMLVSFGLVINSFIGSECSLFKRIVMFVYCASILWYVVLTGSRSGLIAICLILLLNINVSWKTRFCVGIPAIIFILIGIPIISNLLSVELLQRFSISALTGNEGESGTRLIIWKVATKSLNGLWWVIGHGVGASQAIVGNAIGTGVDMAIHNHYIAMITEVGLVGFLALNIPILKMIKREMNKQKEIAFGMIGILFMAMFLDVVTTKFFWSSLLLLSAACASYEYNNFNKGEDKV